MRSLLVVMHFVVEVSQVAQCVELLGVHSEDSEELLLGFRILPPLEVERGQPFVGVEEFRLQNDQSLPTEK